MHSFLTRKTVIRNLTGICLVASISGSVNGQGVTMGWDAADYNGDGTWEVSQFDASISAGSSIAWRGGTTETLVNAATNFTKINSYVQTPDYTLSRSSVGGQSWQDILGDPATKGDATWEMVFRPGDFSGTKPLFDTGGTGSGTGLRLIGNQLNFRFQSSTSNFLELNADLSSIGSANDFYHVVAVANLGQASSASSLYVNGVLISGGGDTSLITDWDGGDDAGLGRVGGTSPQGATFDTAFGGDVAVFRQYNGQILDQSAVRNRFNAVTANASTVTVGWNAADYDGSGIWTVSEFDANQANASNVIFHNGSGTKQSGSTNFANVSTWISSPGFTQGLSPTPGAGNDSFGETPVFGDAFTKQDVTFEMVFRPGDFSGKHMLYEVGGNVDGTLFELDGSTLNFIAQNGTSNVLSLSADLSLAGAATDFFHILAVVDAGDPNSLSGLYVNGALVSILGGSTIIGDWAGADGGNIGVDGNSTAGGDTNDYIAFDGDLAILRLYGGHAFDQVAVDNAFAAMIPEPTAGLMIGLAGLLLAMRRRVG